MRRSFAFRSGSSSLRVLALLTASLALLGGASGSVAASESAEAGPGRALEVRIPVASGEGSAQPGGEAPAQAGTLVLPDGPGPHPAVILVSPAGDHPRDELRSGGEHWADLARRMAARGIASLRVDHRGVGGSRCEAWPEPDRSRTSEDLARDLAARWRFLGERSDIDRRRIGVLAHGDGCVPAAIFAADEGGLAFVVLLSPPGLAGLDNVVAGQLARVPEEAVAGERRDELEAALRAGLERIADRAPREDVVAALEPVLAILGVPEEQRAAAAGGFHDPLADGWTRHFLRFDPAKAYAEIDPPLLALFASDDERYPAAPNRAAIEKAFAGALAFNAAVRSLDGVGHFLEAAEREGVDDSPVLDSRVLDSRVVDGAIGFVLDAIGHFDESVLPRGRAGAGSLRIHDVAVVDVRAGRVIEHRTVDIEDGVIVRVAPSDARGAIGRTRAGSGAGAGSGTDTAGREDSGGVVEVDGTGKFLMPGLWDLHGHSSFHGADALTLLVSHGVTGVRDMGGDLAQIDDWRRRIDAGEILGPRIVRPGPFVDGAKPNFQHRRFVATADEARRAVEELRALGVDFVKVHSRIPRGAFLALCEAARDAGLAVCGHVPAGMRPSEVSAAGMASIEHTTSLITSVVHAERDPVADWPAAYAWWKGPDGERVMREMAERGTAFVPTLYPAAEILTDVNPAFAPVIAWYHDLVGRCHRAGIRILAGTDFARRTNAIPPGASLHRELELLVRSGLTPAEALRAATSSAAHFLGRGDRYGAVEPGLRADLLLLDADPLAAIENTRRIAGVILRGHLHDADLLAAARDRVRAEAARGRL